MRCAFLTMQEPGNFVTDYALGIPPLEDLGWTVDCIPWRGPNTDWDAYDAVYICTPWDYPAHADEFLTVLQAIDESDAVLVNALDLVRWNLTKTYLKDLERAGAAIVPSTWHADFDLRVVQELFSSYGTDRLVLKPQVGANAADTFVLRQPLDKDLVAELGTLFDCRPFLVQPFVESIRSTGEYSLFFLGGAYSHCIQKVPKRGDFRVQEEHGADIQAVVPPSGLVDIAEDVLQLVEPRPVYARVDFVNDNERGYLLMELELIEPSLYLRTSAEAPQKFACAFDDHVRRCKK